MADRSSIWGDVDLGACCRKTGYSREHATRELSRIRREEDSGLAFETKQRRMGPRRRRRWGVIVSRPQKLKFARHSLFYNTHGRPLHIYTKLGLFGLKLHPGIAPPKPQATDIFHNHAVNPQHHPTGPFPEDGVANSIPMDGYDAAPAPCARIQENRSGIRENNLRRLRGKAFGLLPSLEGLHWDNCKVQFNRRTAFSYLCRALRDGHEIERIQGAYERALVKCHGFACDKAASRGEVYFFNLSSTISKARRELSQDGLTRDQRIRQWYEKRAQRAEAVLQKPVEQMTREEVHWAMARSMGLAP